MPLVGGSSSGTRAGRSSLIGGVPLGSRLFGVRGISKDMPKASEAGELCGMIVHSQMDRLWCDHINTAIGFVRVYDVLFREW
jgi:hypothetical protein